MSSRNFTTHSKEETEVEVTRYGSLPNWLKFCFLSLCFAGVAVAVLVVFGFTFRGETMMPVAYYYFLMATFSTCVFVILPARKKDRKIIPWYDLLAATITCGIAFYYFLNAWSIGHVGWVPLTNLQLALAIIFSLLILEGGRRMGGNVYLVVALFFGLYPIFAGHMPGMFYGFSVPFNVALAFEVHGSVGILGLPADTLGYILIGYLLLAGVLMSSGAGKFFIDLATALLGRFRGGPAKVAVLSSAFFGMLSGSALSNVASCGSVTIPLMKRTGYEPHYAGAIEACASTGGVLMPPLMGSVAFVSAAFLGIPYSVIMISAVIPSILYYGSLLMQVDAHAAKIGIKGLPPEELPSLKKTLKEGWQYIFTVVFLLWGLIYMRWETMTPFYASGLLIVLSYLGRKTMLTPRKAVDVLAKTGILITQSMAILLPIGFIIGGLTITGTSTSFTAGLIDIGGRNLWLVLIIGIIVCYILGMAGMLVSAYVLLAVTLAPSIIQLGNLNVVGVHLFIMYYAMLSVITPPVAVASFLAAAIAGANPMKTSVQAMRLGIVIFIIPFFFIFNPSLILQGSIVETLYRFVPCLLGIFVLAAGIEGYIIKVGKIGPITRILVSVAGALIAFPEWNTNIIGVALAGLTLSILLIRRKTVAEKPVMQG